MRSKVTVVMCLLALYGCSTNPPAEKQSRYGIPLGGPHNVTPVGVDPRHPPHIGVDYYPKESLALREQGTCLVSVTVEADGSISKTELTRSSGSPRLDVACRDAFPEDVRFRPSTSDGKPIQNTAVIPVRWCITGSTYCSEPMR
jgi:protein TonB